ncbi:MAG: pantoate--beta-alanine ligase [Bdellovibrionaceae bacterium]|nr:pantoate--beta-alanine ligase [Pseudobdellovibrionaceae bacterium]MBX3032630.1 pantoate--beta-alanine ligase [Pseudobdellovibrionaceae bacterium]
MKVLHTVAEMREWRRSQQGRVGFVPTMGALHEGHASLLARARAGNDLVVLSVFVNPTQFNDPKDFEKYPVTWEADLRLAEQSGVDAVFAPRKEDLYPDGYHYRVQENDFSRELCGAHRPGHFDGVLTVVLKLFQLVRPQNAYFGEKDGQQLQLIRGMVDAFFLDLNVVPVPTVREADGLAMSSRNVRLSPAERGKAPLIFKALTQSKSPQEARGWLEDNGFKVDYIEDRGGRRYIAAFLGETRLIDNVQI